MGFKINNLVNTEGFPFYLIQGLMKEFQIDYFVETGTAGGLSIKEAAKIFKKCWTIELVKDRADISDSPDNIMWLEGNSVDVLPEILFDLRLMKEAIPKNPNDDPKVYQYCVFFLDAHWSEPYENKTKHKDCYVLEELCAIKSYQADALIFIDDARLFCGHPPAPNNPEGWPNIQQLFAVLNEHYPYNFSTIIDDYIVSIPERMREPIDREWRSNYPIRYPSHEDSIKMQTKNVWKEFKKYIDAT